MNSLMGCFLVIATFTFTLMMVYQHCEAKRLNEVDVPFYREKIKKMFYHAYEGYLKHAYPYDELQPLTCKGFDTWGSYSLTLIDALDTLAVIGNNSEFRRVADIVIDKGENIFDMDINVSVFETNIRIVGGLLSAHLLMKRTGMQLEPAWPCSGPLLRMAESIARRLLPAFDTPTGMPYGTVNLRSGVPKGETTVTCTAGVGTFIVEFGTLSRLTGDPIFEKTAIRAIRSLWKFRSPLGLLGNHIDVKTGKWTALDSGIGGGVDSYFEYLVKGSILFNLPELVYLFRDYEEPIKKYLKRDDWYMWAHMTKGTITLPMFTSLDAFWPGIQTLLGDVDAAMKTLHNFQQVWRQFGSTPEYYNIPKAEAHKGREGYPLRPELIESIVYMYRATKDPILLEMGVDIVEAIERTARTSCGYATVKDVRDHRLEDRMESFFLAETAKYLYLLFDPDNFIHNNGSHGTRINTPSGSCIIEAGGYVFNTEAHPIDLASVYCCSAEKQEEDRKLEAFHSNLDLLTLTGLVEDVGELADMDWLNGRRNGGRGKNLEEHEEVGEEDEEFHEELLEEENVLDTSSEEEMLGKLLSEKSMDETAVSTEEEMLGKLLSEKSMDETAVSTEEEAEKGGVSDKTRTVADTLSGNSISPPTSVHQGKDDQVLVDHEEEDSQGAIEISAETDTNEEYSRKLQAIDLRGLSEMERGLAKIIIEQLNVDSDVEDISRKTGRNFKGTEFEKVALFISRQLMQAEKDDEQKAEKLLEHEDPLTMDRHDPGINKGTDDSLDMERNERGKSGDSEKDVILETDDSENTHEQIAIHPRKTSEKENVDYQKVEIPGKDDSQAPQMIVIHKKSLTKDDEAEEDTQSEGKRDANQETADSKDSQKTPALDPTLQKLKDHLEAQLLQQYKMSSPKDDTNRDGKTFNLESKRANLLSLTTKVFKFISRSLTGGDAEEDESSKSLKPSLSGLYKSLADYPLQYFHDPSMMHCPALPFHSRLSVYGEMTED